MKILNAGNSFYNHYLIALDDGYCLLDTANKWEYDKFIKSLNKIGVKLEEIKYIAISHAHADHLGLLRRIIEEVNPIVIYDPRQKSRIEAGKNNMDVYISTFVALMSSKLTTAFVDKYQCFPSVKTDNFVPYTDNPLEKYGIEFLPLEGHTEGDLAVKIGGDLYCGDVCMNCFPSSNHAPLWVENKFQLLKSWEKIIAKTDIATIYPYHGKPFDVRELNKSIEFWREKGVFKLFKKKNYID